MFACTERLLLRHGWPEDGEALTGALADVRTSFDLSRLDWPHRLDDPIAYLNRERAATEVDMLIFLRGDGPPALIGGVGIVRIEKAHCFGLWLMPAFRCKGYAVEAGEVVMNFARETLRIDTLIAEGFCNPHGDRALRRLGFEAEGAEIFRTDVHGFVSPWRRYRCGLAQMGLAA